MNINNFPFVSIIIVFHNGKDQTLRCLKSVFNLKYPNFDITVVDDGSTDGSGEAIIKDYPNVKIIKSNEDLWCNGSFNLAISKCLENDCELFLLLNNDNIIEKYSLNYLIETFKSEKSQIIGSMVCYYHKPETISYAGKLIDWRKGYNILIYNNKNIKDINKEIIDVDFLGFQGVLINKSIFEKIGLIDSNKFVHYFGDTDFYLRAKKAGFKIVVDTRSIVWDDIDTKGEIGVSDNIADFIKELYNVKSLSYVLARYNFYKRHAPQYWLIPFSKYYYGLIYNQILTMIKYRIFKIEGSNGPIYLFLKKLIKKK